MTSKEKIACRTAKEVRNAKVINLGAGLPSFVVNYLEDASRPIIHAEHGIVGCGPDDPTLERDNYRVDASVRPITIIPGGSIIDSATSFGLIRGGHLDISVLGTMQVDEEGNIANWMVAGGRMVGMGGAMDLVTGAKRVIAITEHCSKDGSPKILKKCTYPLTGAKCIDSIITELAVIKVTPEGLVLKEIAPGTTVEEVQRKTEAKLIIASDLRTIEY